MASKQAEAPLLPGVYGGAASGGGGPGVLGMWHTELEGEAPLLPSTHGAAASEGCSPDLLGTWQAELEGEAHGEGEKHEEEDEDGGCTEEHARLEGALKTAASVRAGEPSKTSQGGRRVNFGFGSGFRRKR
jgi:hypothetical protein